MVDFSGKPTVVPDEVIDYIHEEVTEVESQGGLRKGEAVSVHSGPFKGVEGIFQAYDGDKRVLCLSRLCKHGRP